MTTLVLIPLAAGVTQLVVVLVLVNLVYVEVSGTSDTVVAACRQLESVSVSVSVPDVGVA